MDDLIEYYSQRAPEYEEIYHRGDPTRQAELKQIADEIRRTFGSRRVLEVACGTGFWTKILLEVAAEVVATDASTAMLDLARQKLGRHPALRLEQVDAYELLSLGGNFDAALANFWLSHVPRARIEQFLQQLHARLKPGAVIFMADNMNVAGIGGELVRPEGSLDTYKVRQLKDGSVHKILKNYFTADELSQVFRPHCRGLEMFCGTAYWWVRYCVSA
jgi:SAM-dependent methyltransferase